MNRTWCFKICFLFLLVSCAKQEQNVALNYIIELDEFIELQEHENIKIIDLSHPKVYAKNHIKNALNIWRSDIEDTSYEYGGMKASKQQLEILFSNLGITNSDTLLLYDDKGLCEAARFWWVLQSYGFTNIKMLNGGITTWTNNGNSLTTEIPDLAKSNFVFQNNETDKLSINMKQVLLASNTKAIIIDTRTPNEFMGKTIKNGAFKAGRIPNSVLIDWTNAIDYDNTNRLKSKKELEALYSNLKVSKNDSIIVYCHSGVRSAHTAFVLTEILGYKNVFNYDGSWIEWSYNEDYPIESD